MGTVIPFPIQTSAPLSKKRLALAIGYSPRWVELRLHDGMPHERLPNGELRFRLGPVLDWLDEWRNGGDSS